MDHLGYIANNKKVPDHLKEKTDEYRKGKEGKKYQVSKLKQEWYHFGERVFYYKTAKGEIVREERERIDITEGIV